MTNQPQEQEDWKRVEKELEYVATYTSPERREELLRFLKDQFQSLLATEIERAKAEGVRLGRIEEASRCVEWAGKKIRTLDLNMEEIKHETN